MVFFVPSLPSAALSLYLMAVNIKTPVVVENITLMCLRILQRLIKPPAPTSKKNKVCPRTGNLSQSVCSLIDSIKPIDFCLSCRVCLHDPYLFGRISLLIHLQQSNLIAMRYMHRLKHGSRKTPRHRTKLGRSVYLPEVEEVLFVAYASIMLHLKSHFRIGA